MSQQNNPFTLRQNKGTKETFYPSKPWPIRGLSRVSFGRMSVNTTQNKTEWSIFKEMDERLQARKQYYKNKKEDDPSFTELFPENDGKEPEYKYLLSLNEPLSPQILKETSSLPQKDNNKENKQLENTSGINTSFAQDIQFLENIGEVSDIKKPFLSQSQSCQFMQKFDNKDFYMDGNNQQKKNQQLQIQKQNEQKNITQQLNQNKTQQLELQQTQQKKSSYKSYSDTSIQLESHNHFDQFETVQGSQETLPENLQNQKHLNNNQEKNHKQKVQEFIKNQKQKVLQIALRKIKQKTIFEIFDQKQLSLTIELNEQLETNIQGQKR